MAEIDEEYSDSEDASSEDNWIQDDEDADSIGDEELEIYGDDFDSEGDDDDEVVLERDRRQDHARTEWSSANASEPGCINGQHPSSIEVLGESGQQRQNVMARDQDQSTSGMAPPRRARPSDTQRARPSDTRRRTPTRPESHMHSSEVPAGMRVDSQVAQKSAQAPQAWGSTEVGSMHERQIFRGISHTRMLEEQAFAENQQEQSTRDGNSKWDRADLVHAGDHREMERADLVGADQHDGDSAEETARVEHDHTLPRSESEDVKVRDGIQVEIPSKVDQMRQWGLVTSLHPSRPPSSLPDNDPHIRMDKDAPNWLDRVAAFFHETTRSPHSDGEETAPAESVTPVPLRLSATHHTFSLSPVGQYGLSSRHRARINSYLGITEWPPKPVVVEKESPPVAPFISTMYEIVSDPNNWHCVQWAQNGTTVLFVDPATFNLKIIPRYFKGTWKSRTGQLNGTGYDLAEVLRTLRAYGFAKVDPSDFDRMEFHNRWFRRNAASHLHRLTPRRGSRCLSATTAHRMLLPRPWTPLQKRPTTAGPSMAQALEMKPHPPSRGQSARSRRSDGTGSGSVAGPEVFVAHQHALVTDPASTAPPSAPRPRSKFQYLRREQIRRASLMSDKGEGEGEAKQAAGLHAAHRHRRPSLEEPPHARRKPRSPSPPRAPLRGADSQHTPGSRSPAPRSQGGTSSPRSPGARSPVLRSKAGSSPTLLRSRSMRRKAGHEVLVGFEGGVHGEIGMRVKWSEEGIEHKMQDGMSLGWWAQAVGVITEVESDGRMCHVQWQSGGQEWCCTGFSDKYYLQQFVVKQFEKPASTWRKEARLAPQWQWGLQDGVWRLNRLKSQLKVNMNSIKWEADADKLLPTVKRMVARHFHQRRAEQQRQQEELKLKMKMQRRQERRSGKAPHNSPLKPSGRESICGMEDDKVVAAIDNVESVGEFLRSHGPMERLVHLGLLSQLGRVLRKAYDDMDQQPSGNLKHQEVLMAVRKMRLDVSQSDLVQVLKQHDRENSGEVTLDEFLDCMYHILQRLQPPNPPSQG